MCFYYQITYLKLPLLFRLNVCTSIKVQWFGVVQNVCQCACNKCYMYTLTSSYSTTLYAASHSCPGLVYWFQIPKSSLLTIQATQQQAYCRVRLWYTMSTLNNITIRWFSCVFDANVTYLNINFLCNDTLFIVCNEMVAI